MAVARALFENLRPIDTVKIAADLQLDVRAEARSPGLPSSETEALDAVEQKLSKRLKVSGRGMVKS